MLLRFNTRIHPSDGCLDAAELTLIDGLDVRPLVPSVNAEQALFDRSFEQVALELSAIERLFFEPDGSFVWTDCQGQQLDGLLLDRVDRVVLLELHGTARWENLQPILQTLGWPTKEVMFEIISAGIYVSLDDFIRLAAMEKREVDL